MGLAAALAAVAFALTSPVVPSGGKIPVRYTCDGKNVSPPLRWTAPPRGTRYLSLLVVDPDAPSGQFVHWRAPRMPATLRALREGQRAPSEGLNTAGTRGWTGPCPPRGRSHEYLFVLKAVGAGGKTLAEGDLIAHYARR